LYWELNLAATNLSIRLVFPTPWAPRIMIFWRDLGWLLDILGGEMALKKKQGG
jgi:hypothetical protein